MVVRALVAGVGDFPWPDGSEDEQADGSSSPFGALPSVAPAVREVASALDRAGVRTGGDPLLEASRSQLYDRWQKLFIDDTAEALVVHFAGHGVRGANGGLYLAAAGADPKELNTTCVSFSTLLDEAENGGLPVLFLLDVCGAGQAIVQQQLQDLAARRRQDGLRNAWIIGAGTADSGTYGARFTTATATVLHRLADGTLDLTPTIEHVPVDTLAAAIDRELTRTDAEAGGPGNTVVRTPHVEATTEPQPFLRNPAHSRAPHAALLSGMDPRLREFAHTCSPGIDPLHFVTRAAGNPAADVIHFSGRTAQLARIQQWIDNTDGTFGPLLVVTGGPGSGKSALLGVTTCLTHPQLTPMRPRVRNAVRTFRPTPAGRVLAVHARQLTVQQITDSLHHQLHHRPTGPASRGGTLPDGHRATRPVGTAELLEELRATDRVLVILDALDEATDPRTVLDELLLPLADATDGHPSSGCRVMLGTRPWWDLLPHLHEYTTRNPAAVLDLDPSTDENRRALADDLHTYLDLLLDAHYPPKDIRSFADRIAAYTDSGAFLVASLFADHLLSDAPRSTYGPPCSITEVFDLHRETLARSDPWIEPVLAVLGQARGQGIPLDLLHAAALAHQPPAPGQPTPQLTDTRRALTKAAFYLRTHPDTDHRLLYRYFHQALTDHTAPQADPAVIHRVLIATVPRTPGGGHDWARADPYLLRHAAEHATAASGGAFDRLLEDPLFLAHAEPDGLSPHLHHATTTEQAAAHANVYRATTAHHPKRHRSTTRRGLLALDATRYGASSLRRLLLTMTVRGGWWPLWATSGSPSPALSRTLTGHTGPVDAVACTEVEGRAIAVSASRDLTARVWDLTTGRQIGRPLRHDDEVYAVACTSLSGTPVAVTGTGNKRSGRATLHVWDLVTGRLIGKPMTGHGNHVYALACTNLGGRPIAVSASRDNTLIRWDLTEGRQIGDRLIGHSAPVSAVALTEMEGRAVAVSASRDLTVRLWDLVTGEPVREPLKCGIGPVLAAGCTTLRGQPVLLTGHDGLGEVNLRLWDLNTLRPLGEPLTGHTRAVFAVSILPGADSLAVTGSADGTVRVWDLNTGQQRGPVMTGHSSTVFGAAAATVRDRRPVIVTGSGDSSVRLWEPPKDPAAAQRPPGRQDGQQLTGHTGMVQTVACTVVKGRPVAVTGAKDGTVRVWDLATGQLALRPLTGHQDTVTSLVCATRRGRPVAVSGSLDGNVMVWDLIDGENITVLPTVDSPVYAVACAPGETSVIVALYPDGITRQWILDTFSRTGPPEPWAPDVDGPGGRPTGTDSALSAHLTALRLAGHSVSERLPHGRGLAASTTAGGETVVVTASQGKVQAWEAASGRPMGEPLIEHADRVVALACVGLTGGTPIAATAERDGTVRVWDLADGNCTGTVDVADVTAVALTGEGLLVVAFGMDLAVFTRTGIRTAAGTGNG